MAADQETFSIALERQKGVYPFTSPQAVLSLPPDRQLQGRSRIQSFYFTLGQGAAVGSVSRRCYLQCRPRSIKERHTDLKVAYTPLSSNIVQFCSEIDPEKVACEVDTSEVLND
ncbi:hypothetical protein F9C07_4948 [Aspergillus flavus]|uniref:Uncharacterized protein n=1 Tax=Aspergillus flavus (strain ATCC 200026 / FGSC A1120 / IAM 13836 / NRRL 3357 / JCM 12722 / SRRC 167) TaxID=332952 RepID=A0A7U2MLK4_ASPFN|nr:hypothetical protein AFLA70_54g003811 [Aspergillus flavus AF70]QRD85929.1 hypothetical protein F9C07_4948 [Aspergillus flavus]